MPRRILGLVGPGAKGRATMPRRCRDGQHALACARLRAGRDPHRLTTIRQAGFTGRDHGQHGGISQAGAWRSSTQRSRRCCGSRTAGVQLPADLRSRLLHARMNSPGGADEPHGVRRLSVCDRWSDSDAGRRLGDLPPVRGQQPLSGCRVLAPRVDVGRGERSPGMPGGHAGAGGVLHERAGSPAPGDRTQQSCGCQQQQPSGHTGPDWPMEHRLSRTPSLGVH